MKRILLSAALVVLGMSAIMAQDAQTAVNEAAQAIADAPVSVQPVPKPRYWTNSLLTKIDFTQTSLTNWAAGGYNSFTLKSFIDGNANYKKDDMLWNNRLQLDYGFLFSADKPVAQKSDDRIYFESKWGYKAAKNLNYSAQFSFRSQFTDSYLYPVPKKDASGNPFPDGVDPSREDWIAARTLKSAFVSPAYTNLALGIDWVPTKWLTVNFAPLTGGFVIVDRPELRKSYGMERKNGREDTTLYPDTDGNNFRAARFEFGAQLKVDAKLQINDNFNYTTQLVLFSDYLNKPQNMRVNWDNRFDWKLAKYFALTLTTNLIYDDRVMIKSDEDLDKYPNGRQRIQFKESLAFGFSYTIASKKK